MFRKHFDESLDTNCLVNTSGGLIFHARFRFIGLHHLHCTAEMLKNVSYVPIDECLVEVIPFGRGVEHDDSE